MVRFLGIIHLFFVCFDLLWCDAVTTAAHVETALKMLREGKDQFDLVISDVHMPDMDGFMLHQIYTMNTT